MEGEAYFTPSFASCGKTVPFAPVITNVRASREALLKKGKTLFLPNKYREQIHDGEAQGMKESEQKAAAKAFAAHWQGKGYEKGETQPFSSW